MRAIQLEVWIKLHGPSNDNSAWYDKDAGQTVDMAPARRAQRTLTPLPSALNSLEKKGSHAMCGWDLLASTTAASKTALNAFTTGSVSFKTGTTGCTKTCGRQMATRREQSVPNALVFLQVQTRPSSFAL